ncbi:hypothetical protein [Paraburkholderia dilworthii]|uniref:hypothetical protein n=1 Tax=Paraburkholderia dilworthii TaxID=948106 RepID=UPI001427D237|nr:hypothetical protein [Paraburkholderia dilworthii]
MSGERRCGNREARSSDGADEREDALMESARNTISHGYPPGTLHVIELDAIVGYVGDAVECPFMAAHALNDDA